MANVFAVKSGNWSDPTVWNTGELPTPDDDVYANNFTVTVDVSPTILTIRNTSASGITAGGRFVPNSGITLTCSSSIGSVTGALINSLVSAPSVVNILANINSTGTSSYALLHSGSGTVNLTGNVSGGGGNAGHPVWNSSSGTINIIGNINGSTQGGGGPNTIFNSSTGTVNITGNVSFSGGSNGTAINNSSVGTVNITGSILNNAIGGQGCILNGSTGSINITGNAFNNGGFSCLLNNSSGFLRVIGSLIVNSTAVVLGLGSASQRTILTGPFIGSSSGVPACAAARWEWYTPIVGPSYVTAVRAESDGGGYRNLYTADSSEISSAVPIARDVRLGVEYGPNSEVTGTCTIPDPANVKLGIATDNTFGTMQPVIDVEEVWNTPMPETPVPGSVLEKLLSLATVASVGDQIAAMKQASD